GGRRACFARRRWWGRAAEFHDLAGDLVHGPLADASRQPAHSRQSPTTAECARSARNPCSPLSRLASGSSTLIAISSSDPHFRQTRCPCGRESARRQRVTRSSRCVCVTYPSLSSASRFL